MEVTFQKALNCIQESTNLEQLETAYNYLQLFKEKYGDEKEYRTLWEEFLYRESLLKGLYYH